MMNMCYLLLPAQAAPQQPNIFVQLMPILLIFVVFYIFLILPQQRQQKKHKEMIDSLKKGDKIITAGGIYGEVVKVKDDRLKIKISKDTEIEIQKSAITTKIEEEEEKK